MDDKDSDSAIMIIFLMIATSPSSSPASWFNRLTSRLTLLGFKPALNGNIRWYHAIYWIWISPLVIKRYDLADPSCHHLSPLISCPLPPSCTRQKETQRLKRSEDLGAAVGTLRRSPDSVSFGTNWLDDEVDDWPNWRRTPFSAGAGVCRGATPWNPPAWEGGHVGHSEEW